MVFEVTMTRRLPTYWELSLFMEDGMNKDEIKLYEDTENLRRILNRLKHRKFKLDCGHHVTFGCFLGNDITIRNGTTFQITCSQCGY